MIIVARKTLGNDTLPVIVGGLGEFARGFQNGKLKWFDSVNDTLKNMPSELSCCGFASAERLTDRGDQIHFNSTSYRILGKRYFEEYLKM